MQIDINLADAINTAIAGSNNAFIASSGFAVVGEKAELGKESNLMPSTAIPRVLAEQATLKVSQH